MFWGRCSQTACRKSAFAAMSDFLGTFNKYNCINIIIEAHLYYLIFRDYTYRFVSAEDKGKIIPRKESLPQAYLVLLLIMQHYVSYWSAWCWSIVYSKKFHPYPIWNVFYERKGELSAYMSLFRCTFYYWHELFGILFFLRLYSWTSDSILSR